jgi:nicotinate-nucleotide adenylyltransferase
MAGPQPSSASTAHPAAPASGAAGPILLYGGSFDPIHHGHLISARAVAERLGARKVILLPAARSPFKPDTTPAPPEARLEMCRLAAALDPLFEVSDYDLTRPPPSYTIDAVRHFRAVFPPDTPLYWLIGADSLSGLTDWKSIGELAELITFATAARPGPPFDNWASLRPQLSDAAIERIRSHLFPTPEIDISSTDIRRRARNGQSIAYLVPDSVADYIRRAGLYR